MPRDGWGRDLAEAWRRVRADRRTSGLVVGTLALGIGLNLAAYALLDALVLRPLPFTAWRELRTADRQVYPVGVIERLAALPSGLRDVAGVSPSAPATVEIDDRRQRLPGATVTGAFFRTLRVLPLAGRTLGATDARAGAPPTVVLTAGLAVSVAPTPAAAVGRTIRIDGIDRRIVGVLDDRLAYPATARFWLPSAVEPGDAGATWGAFNLTLVARAPTAAADGALTAGLRDQLRTVRTAFPWFMPERWGQEDRVTRLADAVVGGSRLTATLVVAAVLLVLLAAILNVAQLLASRELGRQREVAIRAALGASPSALGRFAASEGLLLTAAGGVLALVIAIAGTRALPMLFGAALPPGTRLALDWTSGVVAVVLALVVGGLVSLLPARLAARVALTQLLSDGGRGTSIGVRQRRAGQLFVGAQLAVSGALITVALTSALTVQRLRRADAGFVADRLLTGEVPVPTFTGDSVARGRAFFTAVPEAVARVPGIEGAAVAASVPLDGVATLAPIEVLAHPTPAGGSPPTVNFNYVSDRYFQLLGMQMRRGRGFTPTDMDSLARVIVVSEAAAAQLWPGESPLGQRVRYVWKPDEYTVVGVVGDVRADSLAGPATPMVYFPVGQHPGGSMRLLVRSRAGDTPGDALRGTIEAMAPGATMGALVSLDALRARATAKPAVLGAALAGFGVVALVLGALGVFAASDRLVRARTREFGIRLALGALPGRLARDVLREGAVIAALGAGAGVMLALATQRLVTVPALADPVVVAPVVVVVFALLVGITLVACWRPARRAAGTDPLVALRAD